jgi:hypothetical protein
MFPNDFEPSRSADSVLRQNQLAASAACSLNVGSKLTVTNYQTLMSKFLAKNSRVSALTTVTRLLSGLSLLLWACAAPGAATLNVNTNINITKSSANNAETTIAVNPLNPNNLFAADTWTTLGRYTTNGGATWQNSNLSAFSNPLGDVSASWDQFGNLFLVQLNGNQAIMIGISTNGGAKFNLIYTSSTTGNDQPTIVTGPSGTNGVGSVWVNYTDAGNNVVAQGAPVLGLGTVGAFSAAQSAPGPGGDFGDIVIGPNGEVMVAYQNNGSGEGPDTIMVNVDRNGLAAGGFGPMTTASSINVGGFAFIAAQPNRSIDSEIGLAWDHSGGPHNGRIYLMYTDRPNISSDDTDIYVRYSDNMGTNWSARVRVNDDPSGNGKSQFLPKIALDQTSGNIAVSWYDCRNSPGNNTAEFWATVSTDGGLTFATNVKVSTGISDANVSATSGFDFGDYTSLAFNAGAFYPCWADNSNSTGDNPAGVDGALDMYFAKITLGGQPAISSLLPAGITNLMGQPAAFTVVASGTAPLSYQWRFNGARIPGATTNVLFFASSQPSNSGNYSVVVTNSFGAVTSGIASLLVIPTVPLPFALNDSLNWTTDSIAPWYGQTNISHDGVAAAQTFVLADNSQTKLRTTVVGPGTLTFWWKVSSQAGADILSFAVNGATSNQISGEVDWQALTYYLPAGALNLQWAYAKDASGSAGQDAAWVDQVIYTAGGTAPFILTQPTNQVSLGGTPATFSVTANGTPALSYQWLFNGAPISGATSNSYTIPSPLASNDGNYTVRITNLYGATTSAVAVFAVVPFVIAGDNSFGQINVPVGATNAIAVAAGAWHTLILRADGLVLAFGNNGDGECDVPNGLSNVANIAAGGYHSLALRSDQSVVAWGADFYGQISGMPVLTNAIAIAAGTWHSLALRSDRTVVAWGDDAFGQIDVPAGLNSVVAIAAGGTHSMALLANGTVVAWGDNEDATGDFVGQSVVPAGLSNVVAIAAGDYHSLAVKSDGTVVGWGDNSQDQAQPPDGLSNVVAIAAGGGHTLALKSDTTATAWGNNLQGQCNNSATLSNIVLLAAGDSDTLALLGTPPAAPTLLHPTRVRPRFNVLVQTYAGRHYAFETKTNLTQPAWSALQTNYGNGVMQFFIDPAATGPRRYYRVRQW